MSKLRYLLVPAAGLIVALAVACGGSDKSSSTGGSGSSDDQKPASASTTIANGTSTAPGAGTATAKTPVSGGETVDLAKLSGSIERLKSFNFDMTLKLDFATPAPGSDDDNSLGDLGALFAGLFSNIQASGSFVGPDSFSFKMNLFGQDFQTIQIGNKSWEKEGSAPWKETTGQSDLDELPFDSPDSLLDGFLPQEAIKAAKVTKNETVNGVKTTHYSFDRDAIASLGEFGAEEDFKDVDTANLDVWVSDDGTPVRILMDVKGKDEDGKPVGLHLEMNLKDINSSSIQIKPPL